MSESMHTFVRDISAELRKKGRRAVFPRSHARLFDARPEDGLWSARELAVHCGAALFVFDQDEYASDAMVQLGFVLSVGLPVFCIVVRRSACASHVADIIKANKLPLFETPTMSLFDGMFGDLFAKTA